MLDNTHALLYSTSECWIGQRSDVASTRSGTYDGARNKVELDGKAMVAQGRQPFPRPLLIVTLRRTRISRTESTYPRSCGPLDTAALRHLFLSI